MSLYNIANKNLTALTPTTFAAEGLQERQDLQEALKGCIDAIAPDCLVISEEFSDWEDSRRRIDLLAIDRNANLVVIELKRDDVGAHMELQALRYAAMISTMTFEKACDYFEQYIEKEGLDIVARQEILDFVDLDEGGLDDFGNDVRIVLASADFGKELTTSVLWLRDKGIDISCVRLAPYRYKDDVLINAEQIIPVPEVEEYQVRFREKRSEQRKAQVGTKDYSKFEYRGQLYNKRNLALVLMTDWIEQKQPVSLEALLAVFDNSIRRRIAKRIDEIPENLMKRFHSSEQDLIELPSGELIAISNQWGVGNIFNLIERVKQDGLVVIQSN
ncbi:hypothetical protein [Vibrio splendidus]|uniref:hypothetical protein n=1 Tax=Vibrio splendidus TaxID=29497 RepID=UPI000C830F70|nr:hypothetical protein [Vibrio splendidus]PMG18448.1 hypothetical protein BCU95_23565 [Vibrio splendidus]PMM99899.1 hypothetical protein BCT41_12550 [Vibrio splendidus]